MNICTVGTGLLHANTQTCRSSLPIFHYFANGPSKNDLHTQHYSQYSGTFKNLVLYP